MDNQENLTPIENQPNITPAVIPNSITSLDQDEKITTLAHKVIEEQDFEQSKKLVDLFNWNISKKNVVRILKLNGLFDKISDQMIERFEKRPDEISNKDLLDYMQAVQTAIEKSTKSLAHVEEIPTIQLQQNTQVNINVLDNFDRDAKERIANAIKEILKSGSTPISTSTNIPQDLEFVAMPTENVLSNTDLIKEELKENEPNANSEPDIM